MQQVERVAKLFGTDGGSAADVYLRRAHQGAERFVTTLGDQIGAFIERHPTMKILALSFLLLIGVTLVADGFGFHIDKAYIYAAMGFSVFVEALNLRRTRAKPHHVVELNPTFVKDEGPATTA